MRKLFSLIFAFSAHSALALTALPMQQVADGVYVHHGLNAVPDAHNHGEIANIGFIVGERCVAVIDSGGNPQQGQALKQAIEHTTKTPICYVINTHVHPDHIYGNRAFQDGKVKFVGHHKLARAMATRGGFYLAKSEAQIGFKLTPADMIAPDMEVKDSLTLDLGGRSLSLTAHPTAHTDNDLSVYDAKTKTLWLADLLFATHLPVIDGSLNGWLKIISSLEKQSYTTVIPGHGAIDKSWPASLQPQKTYLLNLQSQIRALLKQGKFLEHALSSIKVPNAEHWTLIDDFHRKNITTAFAELEWEDTP